MNPRQIQTAVVANNPKSLNKKNNQCWIDEIRSLSYIKVNKYTSLLLPEITPSMVMTEKPDAGVLAQKLNKYAIKIAGIPWNKVIRIVAPEINEDIF